MKGIDLTPEQIAAAEQFVLHVRKDKSLQPPEENREIVHTWGDFIRVVAWYGEMGYKAGREGINSLEKPGEVFSKREELAGESNT